MSESVTAHRRKLKRRSDNRRRREQREFERYRETEMIKAVVMSALVSLKKDFAD